MCSNRELASNLGDDPFDLTRVYREPIKWGHNLLGLECEPEGWKMPFPKFIRAAGFDFGSDGEDGDVTTLVTHLARKMRVDFGIDPYIRGSCVERALRLPDISSLSPPINPWQAHTLPNDLALRERYIDRAEPAWMMFALASQHLPLYHLQKAFDAKHDAIQKDRYFGRSYYARLLARGVEYRPNLDIYWTLPQNEHSRVSHSIANMVSQHLYAGIDEPYPITQIDGKPITALLGIRSNGLDQAGLNIFLRPETFPGDRTSTMDRIAARAILRPRDLRGSDTTLDVFISNNDWQDMNSSKHRFTENTTYSEVLLSIGRYVRTAIMYPNGNPPFEGADYVEYSKWIGDCLKRDGDKLTEDLRAAFAWDITQAFIQNPPAIIDVLSKFAAQGINLCPWFDINMASKNIYKITPMLRTPVSCPGDVTLHYCTRHIDELPWLIGKEPGRFAQANQDLEDMIRQQAPGSNTHATIPPSDPDFMNPFAILDLADVFDPSYESHRKEMG